MQISGQDKPGIAKIGEKLILTVSAGFSKSDKTMVSRNLIQKGNMKKYLTYYYQNAVQI